MTITVAIELVSDASPDEIAEAKQLVSAAALMPLRVGGLVEGWKWTPEAGEGDSDAVLIKGWRQPLGPLGSC